MSWFIHNFFTTAWDLFKDLWYWAIIGVVLSRILSKYLSEDRFKDKMLKNGVFSVFVSTIAGAILPLCACGVIPFLVSFLRIGAPLAIVMAFTAASPLMDPEDFVVTVGLIDVRFAVFKTISAFVFGMLIGCIVLFKTKRGQWLDQIKVKVQETTLEAEQEAAATAAAKPPMTMGEKVKDFLSFFWFATRYLLLAIVLGSLLNSLVPDHVVQAILGGDHWYSIPLASLIGITTYGVSSVPFVKILLAMGVSKGAGLAFLISGHTTSIGLLVTLYTLVRKQLFWTFVACAFLISMVFGYIFNFLT